MNDERLRIELATALVQLGAADDEAELFQWYPCVDTPACRATMTPPSPCACSGIPYLSDEAWDALGPIVRLAAANPGQVYATRPRRHWMDRVPTVAAAILITVAVILAVLALADLYARSAT